MLCNNGGLNIFFCAAIISQARHISQFEEAQLCNNRLLRRNSNLSTENQELYQQVDDLTNEIKTLRGMLLESCEDFKSKSGRRLSPMNHGKDELMLELASVCEENKKLHIQIEKLTSALELKEKESKSMNTELTLLRDNIKEHVTIEHTLGTISKYLDESLVHTDSPGSKRSDEPYTSLTSDDSVCTSVNSINIETGNGVLGELVHKGNESTMITTNEDSSIDDSLVLGEDLKQNDSGRSLGYSKADESIPKNVKIRSFQERLDALMQSNAKLLGEKIEMEKYVEETVAENESLNAQVSEVCYHT